MAGIMVNILNAYKENLEKFKKEFRKFDTLTIHIPRQPICLR